MKLKTSFFNREVLKKDITRFAPVWGLYTLFLLIYLFLLWSSDNHCARFAANVPYIMNSMGIVNFLYGGICALMLFGDLFSSKMANALHAMPMRREGWFLTHSAAGLLFCLVPDCLTAAVAAVLLQEYWYLAFLWLAVTVCQFLFFFGAGAFSVQCAGNKLGATAVYALFHFLSVLVAFLIATFYMPVLYGIELDLENMFRCSPVVGFTMSQYVEMGYNNHTGIAEFESILSQDWRFLFLSLAVGLAMFAAAVPLYRHRQLESAGDFIAVRPVVPIFLVLYALCASAALYFIAEGISGNAAYLFLIVGLAIGFFTGWMLLEKRVHVFRLKQWLGFCALALVLLGTIALTWLDPLGITRYVPLQEQVEKVELCPYASSYYLDNHSLQLTEEEDIAQVLNLHTELVKNRNLNDVGICVQLRYHLKNGTQCHRLYYLPENSPVIPLLNPYFSSFRFVTQAENAQQFLKRAEAITFHSYYDPISSFSILAPGNDTDADYAKEYGAGSWLYFPAETALEQDAISRGLMDAITQDCEAGMMTQLWEYHPDAETVGNLDIRMRIGGQTEYFSITVFSDCVNTVAYLNTLGRQ